MNNSDLNRHDNINHLDDMIRHSPAPQPGINVEEVTPIDDFSFAPTIQRLSDGTMVVMHNGQIIGSMLKKKMSYEDSLKARFAQKRLAAKKTK